MTEHGHRWLEVIARQSKTSGTKDVQCREKSGIPSIP